MTIRIYFCIAIFYIFFCAQIHAQCYSAQWKSDSTALANFYKATSTNVCLPNTIGWINKWDLTKPMSQWSGLRITGNSIYYSVNSINLPKNNMSGLIAPLLTLCPFSVDTFSARANCLQGNLDGFNYNYSLRYLDLYANFLGGKLPKNLWNTYLLEYLNLGGNSGIVDSIPAAVQGLTNIKTFSIENLSDNPAPNSGLIGKLPPQINNLRKLNRLFLSGNRLTGQIPYFNSPTMQILELDHNQFDGFFPLLDSARNYTILKLNHNKIGGPIPDRFGQMVNLGNLQLNNNQFTGTIPKSLGSCVFLNIMDFGNNLLSGVVPLEITFASKYCNTIRLDTNNLSGVLPSILSRMDVLYELNFARNNFISPVPRFDSVRTLAILNLSENLFTGRVPINSSNINLFNLDISKNKFDSLGDLRAIFKSTFSEMRLDLSDNKFTFDDILPNMELQTRPLMKSFKYLGQDSIICQKKGTLADIGKTYTIALGIDGALTTNVYRWFKDGKLIDRTNVNRLTLTEMQPCQAGVYSCEVTNPAVPGMTLLCPNQTFTFFRGPESCAPYSVATFPNPVQNALNITIVSPPDDVRLVKMHNMLGQQVFATQFDEGNLVNGLQIDCADFPNGSYFLSFYTEGGQISLTKRVQVLKK